MTRFGTLFAQMWQPVICKYTDLDGRWIGFIVIN